MQRRTLLLILSVSALFCLPASAQTVDELIMKHLEARGGLEKWKAVKSMKLTGRISMQGMEMPMIIQRKRPNLARTEITFQGMTIVSVYDGETGWMINPLMGANEPEKMPEEVAKDLKQQSDLAGSLIDYKEKGHTVELVGKEEVQGAPAYKLKLTMKGGAVMYIYLDSQNYLEVKHAAKRQFQGMEVEAESYFSNYKSVNGLMIPHSLEIKARGSGVTQSWTFDKIEVDVEMDDAIFKMPIKKEK